MPFDLLDQLVFETEMTEGRPGSRPGPLAPFFGGQTSRRAPIWTEDEDAFLKANLGYLAEDEIAALLGRSVNAIHLRWFRELALPAPSKDPAYITTYQAGLLLGVDSGHVMQNLVDRGLLPGEYLPVRGRTMRRIKRITFERWVINPQNWVYFDPAKITDPRLRRLCELRAARWGDAWLTPNEVADLRAVSAASVKAAIYRGVLPFRRVVGLSGRPPRRPNTSHPDRDMGEGFGWGNLYILRSAALAARFYPGAGPGSGATVNYLKWDSEADAFMILAAAVGNPITKIDRMLGLTLPNKRTEARLAFLHKTGKLAGLIAEHQIPVQYDPETGALWADWHLHTARFPALARSMRRYEVGGLRYVDLLNVRAVLSRWAAWHLPQSQATYRRLRTVGGYKQLVTKLAHARRVLEAHGLEVL